jgi:AP-3 complex subunit delta-1
VRLTSAQLEMLGHPHLSQYAFPVIECMSSSRFHLKQIGYLAASQSFREGTDVILLTNNLIKKVRPSISA